MKLKLGFIFIAFVMFPAIAGSQSTTVGGHIACFEESDMDDIIQFVAARS